MTHDDPLIEELARVMRDKRHELIAQPLSRIWPDLARAVLPFIAEARRNMRERAANVAGATFTHGLPGGAADVIRAAISSLPLEPAKETR